MISSNDLLQLEFETQADTPPTTEELSLADEIIFGGLTRAMAVPKRLAQEIWAEFDAILARIAAHALVQDHTIASKVSPSAIFR
jgi:hypothetical protein